MSKCKRLIGRNIWFALSTRRTRLISHRRLFATPKWLFIVACLVGLVRLVRFWWGVRVYSLFVDVRVFGHRAWSFGTFMSSWVWTHVATPLLRQINRLRNRHFDYYIVDGGGCLLQDLAELANFQIDTVLNLLIRKFGILARGWGLLLGHIAAIRLRSLIIGRWIRLRHERTLHPQHFLLNRRVLGLTVVSAVRWGNPSMHTLVLRSSIESPAPWSTIEALVALDTVASLNQVHLFWNGVNRLSGVGQLESVGAGHAFFGLQIQIAWRLLV